MSGNVKVVCRFRPQNSKEKARGAVEIVEIAPDGETVKILGNPPHTFNFDRIFPMDTTQKQVYDYAAKPVVEDLFKGYNGTIFAYGQTGSGKTHTMQGPDIHDENLRGLIPRIIGEIFATVEEASEDLEFLVKVSYIEIYMEKIRDLLNPDKTDLKIRENKDKSVYIEGVTEVYVTNDDDVMNVMDTGAAARKVAATNMNDVSSRSHSIFILTIQQKNLSNGTTMSGVLYLVDLAGSEKVAKTGATGQTLDEAKGINKSLSALGNVINALTDGKSKHIPYRDSKLTRILQQSLGGNSRTTLVINCSPSSYNEDETISTLRFGTRAKTIKNRAKVNKEMSVAELTALLQKATQEIARLKAYISGMEEELYALRGDSPVRPPSKGAGAAPKQLLSPDSREKLPNVARIQERCNELEEKVKELEEEKSEILEKQDSLMDNLRDKEQELIMQLELVEQLQERLTGAIATQEKFEKENNSVIGKMAEMRIAQERLEFDNKELQLTIENLTEQKDALQEENQTLQKEIAEFSEMKKKFDVTDSKKERRKSRMLALEKTQLDILEGAEQIRRSLELDVNRMEQMGSVLGSADGSAAPLSPASPKEGDSSSASAPSPATPTAATVIVDDAQARQQIEELQKKLEELQRANESLARDKDTMANKLKEMEKAGAASQPKSLFDIEPTDFSTLDVAAIDAEMRQQGRADKMKAIDQSAIRKASAAPDDGLDLGLDLGDMDVHDFDADPIVDDPDAIIEPIAVPPATAVAGGTPSAAGESFEVEMLRTEMRQQEDIVVKLQSENKKLTAKIEAMRAEYHAAVEKFKKEKEEEWASQNEEKRLKLEQELNELRVKTANKLSEFDALKTSLLRDLQNRCEKVIDLEMLLDEAREQYEQLLKKSSNKSLQKRNMFLERNLEQLTRVHQQLVNQNNALRLEKKVSEKKLAARNERIRGLEVLLASAQEKLQQQAEENANVCAEYKQTIEDLKVKLEKAMNRRQRAASLSMGAGHARIARPIRGGGGRKKADGTVSASSSSSASADQSSTSNGTAGDKGKAKAGTASPAGAAQNAGTPSRGFLSNIFRGKSTPQPNSSNGEENEDEDDNFEVQSNLGEAGAPAASPASPYKAPQ